MKKVVVFFLAGFLALLARTLLFDHVTRWTPDLLLVVVVYLGIFRDPVKGLPLVFVLGGLADVTANGGFVGLTSLIYLAVFMIARLTGRLFYARNPLIQGIIVAATGALHAVAAGVILHGYGVLPSAWPAHPAGAVVRALLAGLVAPAIFWALFAVDAWIAPDEPRHRTIGRQASEWGEGWAR